MPSLLASFTTKTSETYVLSAQMTLWFEVVFGLCVVLAFIRKPKGALLLLLALVAVCIMQAWVYLPSISTVMTSTASLLLLAVPLNHAYNMAYRDELTGLLGRRALKMNACADWGQPM